MKLIERTSYLDEMKDLLQTPDIKVITGVRRSGKSKLLDALAAWLNANDPDANIIHINYNLTEFESLMEYHALEDYVEDLLRYLSKNGELLQFKQNEENYVRDIADRQLRILDNRYREALQEETARKFSG